MLLRECVIGRRLCYYSSNSAAFVHRDGEPSSDTAARERHKFHVTMICITDHEKSCRSEENEAYNSSVRHLHSFH